MRRLVVLAGLVGSFVLVGFTGWGDASPVRAHAAATAPLKVIKARDGEVLAFARVIIHGRAFPFLIDTGSSKTLVDNALAKKLHLKTVGRPIKVTGVGC
jgi:predicted aspartyl protease